MAITSFLLCPGHYWETECNLNDCCKNLPLYQMIARSCWCIHSYVFTYLSEFVCVLAEVCMCCTDSGLEHQRFPSLSQCGLGRTATAYLISFTAEVCQRLRPPNESWHTHTLKSHLLWMMGEGSLFKGTPLPPSSLALKVTPQHLCLLIISGPLNSGGSTGSMALWGEPPLCIRAPGKDMFENIWKYPPPKKKKKK